MLRYQKVIRKWRESKNTNIPKEKEDGIQKMGSFKIIQIALNKLSTVVLLPMSKRIEM